MSLNQPFQPLHPPTIPSSIYLLSMHRVEPATGVADRQSERSDGDHLLTELLHRCSSSTGWELDRNDGCKPMARLGTRSAWVSLSHTKRMMAAAASLEWNLGIDMEPLNRHVPPGLARRMLHPEETSTWAEGESKDLLKLWTLKEAALKQCGTGLRTRMKQVAVHPAGDAAYLIRIREGDPLRACSWREADHWISLVWGSEV